MEKTNRLIASRDKSNLWGARPEQILPSLRGLEVRKYPAAGEVFFLDFPSPETPSRLRQCDSEAEFACFLFEELDLLSAVSVLIVLSTFVHVLLTILQHSKDQPGKPMGHRRDGFRSTEL